MNNGAPDLCIEGIGDVKRPLFARDGSIDFWLFA